MGTTLNTLKNTYAQEQGYEDWETFLNHYGGRHPEWFDQHWTEICIRAQKALQEKTYESINPDDVIKLEWGNIHKSITNPENLIR